MIELDKIYNCDCLEGLRQLPDACVDCCVTSPPYYALRDYGCEGQIGLEETPEKYIERLTEVFMEVHRVMKPEGTLWLNIGDSYWGGGWRNAAFNEHSGSIQKGSKGTHCGETMPALKGKDGVYKPKDLIGIPWMLAFALRNAGWYLRQDIIWHKPNPMPESVTDRCTKSHEYIFLMSKSQKYYYDNEAIQEKATYQDIDKLSKIKFGGNKYGENNDIHFQTYSGKEYKPRTQNQGYAKAGGHRDVSGGFSPNSIVRNKRDVWSVNLKPDSVAHFATYPEELIRPCILAGCPKEGIVLDPIMGSGTTARVARKWGRHYVGFELNPEYIKIINRKVQVTPDLFAE